MTCPIFTTPIHKVAEYLHDAKSGLIGDETDDELRAIRNLAYAVESDLWREVSLAGQEYGAVGWPYDQWADAWMTANAISWAIGRRSDRNRPDGKIWADAEELVPVLRQDQAG